MDLVSTVRKSGSRGGVNFNWDEVANSSHRENYLGHSLKAPVGRWQKGKDLGWYAKAEDSPANADETDAERMERERKEEMRRVKEAEEDAMAKALGLPPPVRNTSGANAIEVGGDKSRTDEPVEGESKDMKRGRSRRDRDSERKERRRHRSRSPSRGYDDRKPRRRHRERSREGEDRRHTREQERSERRDRHRRDRSRERRRSRSGERRRRSPSPRDRRR